MLTYTYAIRSKGYRAKGPVPYHLRIDANIYKIIHLVYCLLP